MELKIINPEHSTSYTITWLELNTPGGNFIVLPGHAPMIATLVPHKQLVFCLDTGKKEVFFPKRGIVEVHRDHVTILMSE